MHRPSKIAFTDFKYIHQGEIYIFKEYESLYAFKLLMSHWTLSPFIKLSRALERKVERKLEKRYDLPEGYLAGLQYRCPRAGSYKSLAKAKASEFHYKKLQHEIQVSLDRFVPNAIELFAKHHQVYFALESPKELEEVTYQRMAARYDKIPTHQGPRRLLTPSPSPVASAPPFSHKAQVYDVPSGDLES